MVEFGYKPNKPKMFLLWLDDVLEKSGMARDESESLEANAYACPSDRFLVMLGSNPTVAAPGFFRWMCLLYPQNFYNTDGVYVKFGLCLN